MHYSQQRSAVSSTLERPGGAEHHVLRVHLQGFIDAPMLAERVAELDERLQSDPPTGVFCDLRSASGYGPGTPTLARDLLALAHRVGVRRVALVATSSVVRTAATMLARGLALELRCFLGETEAQRWLAAGDPTPRLKN